MDFLKSRNAWRLRRIAGLRSQIAWTWFAIGIGTHSAPVCQSQDVGRTAQPQIDAASRQADKGSVMERWIEQLGDDRYAVRRTASQRLLEAGFDAMEPLQRAASGADPQIAQAAQYLLLQLKPQWTLDSDPPAVRELFRMYGGQPLARREALLQQLITQPQFRTEELGAPVVLARIARLEPEESLSLLAALLMIESPPPTVEGKQALAESIGTALADCDRAACRLLQLYGEWLRDGTLSITSWQDWMAAHPMESMAPRTAEALQIHQRLARWCGERLMSVDRRQDATDFLEKAMPSIDAKPATILEWAKWAIDQRLPQMTLSLAERLPEAARSDPELGYLIAESLVASGREQEGEARARQLLERQGVASAVPDLLERHAIATKLLERRRNAWALAEYGRIAEQLDPLIPFHLAPLRTYSSLLMESERWKDGEKLWEPIAQRLQTEPLYVAQVDRSPEKERDTNSSLSNRFLGNYWYFRAKAAGDGPTRQQATIEAWKSLPYDTDVLIELAKWSREGEGRSGQQPTEQEVRGALEAAATKLRNRRQKVEQDLRSAGEDRRFYLLLDRADACNQLAWLLANTGGDLQEALASAKQATADRPKTAAFADTLAAVYWAQGNRPEAIAWQKKAIELEPTGIGYRKTLERYQSQ
jgi:tetratricopeptide (TPR) repeat protein